MTPEFLQATFAIAAKLEIGMKGEMVTFRRAPSTEYTVRAKVSGYNPDELGGGIQQGDRKILVQTADLPFSPSLKMNDKAICVADRSCIERPDRGRSHDAGRRYSHRHGTRLEVAIRTKIDPIDRDIELLLSDLSSDGQSAALASFAKEQLLDAQDVNTRAIGATPPHQTFVDGRLNVNVDGVKPDGVIVYEFDLFAGIFGFIDLLLIRNSPVKTGRYRRSHILLADGVEVDQDAPLVDAKEFIYLNTQPYARKIEKGLSQQAPDGVYQVVATLAAARFGNIAKITFGYRRLAGGAQGGKEDRQPAIIITVG